jgi:hypothetical protein
MTFNGSSSLYNGDLGYDIPFLVKSSGFRLDPTTKVMKMQETQDESGNTVLVTKSRMLTGFT